MIPFNRPALLGNELAYVEEAFARMQVSGDGHFCRKVESLLAEALAVPKVLLTTSCTHALEMGALLLDLEPGDEVIVPSFTFVSTINAFVLRGAKPVFADIRGDTLNIDELQVEKLVTDRTRAILPVHYAGVGCEMDALDDIAERHDLTIIEDNAHGLFGAWRGRQLGTFGALATQSFHETKNFTCGEGGALVISDERLVERAEILREKGTNRSRFFRGKVDKYTWVDVGSSYVLSDILGAVLLAQLERRDQIQEKRRAIWKRYETELAGWAERVGARLPIVPAHCEQAWHLFYLLLPNLEKRTAFIAHLGARDVKAAFHYVPLHRSPMGSRLGGEGAKCPVTEDVSDRLVRLPLYTQLTEEEQGKVIEAVLSFG